MHESIHQAGFIAGTGALLRVLLGFIPKYVKIFNPNDAGFLFPTLEWWHGMTAATALKRNAGTYCLAAAGLAIGAVSAAKVLIANTVAYLIAGVAYSKTTAEVAFTATNHDIAPDADLVQEACYLLSLDAAGTCTITMGTIANGAGNAQVPACPAGEVAIGYVRIAVDAGATPFNASTDELTAAHLTVAYVDYYTLGFPGMLLGSGGISEYAGEAPNTQLAGTVAMAAAGKTITGTSTAFLTDLKVGDEVKIGQQKFTIAAVASATSATTNEAAEAAASGAIMTRCNGREAGFSIGADADINVSGETIHYLALG